MDYLTQDEFNKENKKNPYYDGRWGYFNDVINLIKRYNISGRVLELGCSNLPLVKGSDTWDIDSNAKAKFNMDATLMPWPFTDKEYDLFIALQTWEHLKTWQRPAFNEAIRISKHIILSFPYLWNCPADPIHHNITSHTIHDWTNGNKPVDTMISGRRIIYYYVFTD